MGKRSPIPQLGAPDYPRPERLEYYRALYMQYHDEHAKFLAGKVSQEHVDGIARMVRWWRSRVKNRLPRLLDYGSGKGFQYLTKRIHEQWGGVLPYCYDLGVFHLAARPTGRFDGIICTDVMEHLEEEDIQDVFSDLVAYIGDRRPAFVYMNICCRPAWKKFSDGTNLHKTIQPPDWWEGQIKLGFDKSKIKVERSYMEAQNDKLVSVCAGDVPSSGGHTLPESLGEESSVSGLGFVPIEEDRSSPPSGTEQAGGS